MVKIKYYNSKIEDIFKELKTNKYGLNNNEVKRRLNLYGKNILKEDKKRSNLLKFIDQFKNSLIIILIVSSIVSFIIALINDDSYLDSIIIITIVIMNAILSFIQEAKADKSIEALKNMSITSVKVRRNDKIVNVDIESLVVGDIIILEAGDYVPADARIINCFSIKTDEASLTGESVAVIKGITEISKETELSEISNMVFAGTNIVYGHGEAVVVATGMNTVLGSIALSLKDEIERDTPLEIKIKEISKVISIIITIVIIIMFIIGLIKGIEIYELLLLSISLAVAAIPEGLPTVITITLSLGMGTMAKKKAIIRKMSSVETLGSTEIICSDKTGTITQNKMTIRSIYYNNHLYNSEDGILESDLFIKAMALCNDVIKEDDYIGDPTEIAVFKYLDDLNYKPIEIRKSHKRINEIPFDSERKMMSTVNKMEQTDLLFAKGSLDSIIKKCTHILINGKVKSLTNEMKNEIKEVETKEANKALRLLGYAYKELNEKDVLDENKLVFIGLVGMIDPPRDQVKEAITMCHEAGIKPIMITGDSLNTACSIAKEIGIITNKKEAIVGKKLDKYSDEQLQEIVKKYSVYARVSPAHKLRIVKAWENNSKVVAMTGDGVNDAPAIKKADIGIGMGITGTNVSKNVSDVILVDDCFNTIVDAVREGRRIFDNIRNVILYLLTGNIAEVLVVFIALFGGMEILLPLQLLYINLITDSLPAIGLSFEKEANDIMKREVRNIDKPFFNSFMIARMLTSAIFKTIVLLVSYYLGSYLYDSNVAITMTFLSLVISEMLFAISCKNLKQSVINKNIFSNSKMNIGMIVLIIVQFIVFLTPIKNVFGIVDLNIIQFSYVLGLCFVLFIFDEVSKSSVSKIFKD